MGGEVDRATGRVKEAAGDLTGNRELKARGRTQRAAGNVKRAGSKLGDKVENAADRAGNRVKR